MDVESRIDAREQALRAFVARALRHSDFAVEPASSDASFRSYWRVRAPSQTLIVMNAPPDKEDVRPWLDIANRLNSAGVHAPEIIAADSEQGFILMGDLGHTAYLSQLNEQSVAALYGDAMQTIIAMQLNVNCDGLPSYDASRLETEMALFPTWFVARHFGHELNEAEQGMIESTFRFLLDQALAQPVAFVHRDYHSRNLMLTPTRNPGVIDFQDAVIGPITYDLVSLLRDCYIEWPESRVQEWVRMQHQRSVSAGLTSVDGATFQAWFDAMGLQRHIKVLGIFCRLWYRDGKANYLNDLPLVLKYTIEVAERHPQTAAFAHWLRALTHGRALCEPRADDPRA